MKLLLDNNLSHKLVGLLQTVYPSMGHLRDLDMRETPDETVWEYARLHDCCLVTKDSDYNDMLSARGFPPKVIWLHVGNCTTATIAALMTNQHTLITHFLQDDQFGLLELW